VAEAPTVTGNVTITVNDGSGNTCTGTVAAGTCNLTLTMLGSKTLTATYSSDARRLRRSDALLSLTGRHILHTTALLAECVIKFANSFLSNTQCDFNVWMNEVS
jgi:hypothetical protein